MVLLEFYFYICSLRKFNLFFIQSNQGFDTQLFVKNENAQQSTQNVKT